MSFSIAKSTPNAFASVSLVCTIVASSSTWIGCSSISAIIASTAATFSG